LGDLAPGSARQINIRGVIEGEAEQLRAFEVKAGPAGADKAISLLYNDIFKTVVIKKPFLSLGMTLGGRPGPFAQTEARAERYSIEWANNLPVQMENVSISGRLSGNALDPQTVEAESGYYSSAQDKLLWNKNTLPALGLVDSGVGGDLGLSIGSLPLVSGGETIKNPQIGLDLSISGSRVSEDFAHEIIETNLSRTIKIDSRVGLSARAVYHDGPFGNTGPIPPAADTATTYTVIWSVKNSSNDLSKAVVRAVLPLSVKWVGLTSPAGEKVTYDDGRREIIWELGAVAAGAGYGLPARQALFQVSLTPSVGQSGSAAVLAGEPRFEADDDWSGSRLLVNHENVTTDISTDARYRNGDGIVQ
jgi:hypothetical protein